MPLAWLLGTRRKLLSQPVTANELKLLDDAVWQARYLNSGLREKLARWVRVFISEKNWEGCNGQEINERIQWTIASAAGLLVLAYDDWYYDRTQTILVYPAPYVATEDGRSGFATSTPIPALMGEFPRAGQTTYRGPVIVNWRDVVQASHGPNQGDHLAIHEFSHQLDMLNGPAADGLPPLPENINEGHWHKAFKREFEAARSLVAQGHTILMNDYSLSQESEYFAVGSEYYFQQPTALSQFHPQLFALLNDFYQLDLRELLPAT